MVELFAIKTLPEEVFEAFREKLMNSLPEESRTSILKFKKAQDLQRSVLGEVLARKRLSELTGMPAERLRMERSAKGKPELKDHSSLHFNVSHSGDWVVVALSDRAVGIDVEKIRTPEYRIAERFFSEHELDALNKLTGDEKKEYFFDLWTLKESYLKLLGKGLTRSLGSFTIRKAGEGFKLIQNGMEEGSTHLYQVSVDPAYKVSVCCQSGEFSRTISRIRMQELLNQPGDGKKE